MAQVLAPDGRTVTLDGLRTPPTPLNFNLGVVLDAALEAHFIGVMPGRTIEAFRQIQLPPSYAIVATEELQHAKGRLGVAQLKIGGVVGDARDVIWIGLQTRTSFVRTAFRGADRAAAVEKF